MTTVSFTELRNHMGTYFDRVADDREPLVVTRPGGKENVVVISESEFAGWQETVHLLSSPANAERMARSLREVRAGGATEHDLVAPEMARKRA
jgi:antitoxin YefM